MYEVSTSILNAEKGQEANIIFSLEKAKTDYLHIDVMDGKLVEKNTYNRMLELSNYVKRISNLPLDVHLMVENIIPAINDFIAVEPNIITFHLEACKNDEEVFNIINLIKENNARVGIAIKPNTSINQIFKFLPYIHICLIMTVEPGKGGQTLITDMIQKIDTLKKHIETNNLETQIEVDGGINLATHEKVKAAGAEILVSGTAIIMAKNYKDIIDELKN